MKNIFAYTGIDYKNYPGYVSLNETDDGKIKLTVRSPEHNGLALGEVEISREMLASLSDAIRCHLKPKLGNCNVFINGTKHVIDASKIQSLSYENISDLAGLKAEHTPTVVWALRDNRGGCLIRGQFIDVLEGLRIEACYTGNA